MPAIKRMTHEQRRERRKAIAEYVGAGKSVYEACQKFKVGAVSVTSACREFGIAPATVTSKMTAYAVLKRLLDGGPQHTVAIEFGISAQRVCQLKRKAIEAGFTFPENDQ